MYQCALCYRSNEAGVKSDFLRTVCKRDRRLLDGWYRPHLSADDLYRLPNGESDVCTNRRACESRWESIRNSEPAQLLARDGDNIDLRDQETIPDPQPGYKGVYLVLCHRAKRAFVVYLKTIDFEEVTYEKASYYSQRKNLS